MAGCSAQATKLIRDLPVMDWWARQRAIMALQSYPAESYIPCLVENIRNHADADARNASMEVLVALGQKAIPVLDVLIGDDDPEVRLFAVNMICSIGDAAAVPLLDAAFRDEDVNVRAACVEALGKIGGPEALAVCRAALSDGPWVAMAAVHALGEMGGAEALDLLYGFLDNQELQELTIRAIEAAGTRDSIRHLTGYFSQSHLTADLLRAIVVIAEREGVRPNPEYFLSLRPMMREMLHAADPALRRNAFIALCWSEDIGGIQDMLEAIREGELQEYAIDGLLSIGRRGLCSVVDDLKGSAGQHRVILAKLLSMMGEPMALLQFAADHDPEVRTEVALAMGELRELERAQATLQKMLSDPHEEVRAAARAALRSHGQPQEGA